MGAINKRHGTPKDGSGTGLGVNAKPKAAKKVHRAS